MRDGTREAARERTRGTAYVAVGSILYGTTGLYVTFLAGLPIPTLLALRFALGGVFLVGILALSPWRRNLLAPRATWPHLLGLGALLALVDVFFYASIRTIGVGLSAILLYTAPLFVAALSTAFLGERPGRRTLAGLAAGFAGVVLVALPQGGVPAHVLGIAAGVSAGAAWGGWLVVSRAAGERGAPSEAQGAASTLVAAAVFVPVALAVAPVVPSPRDVLLLLQLGLLAGALALVLIARGLRDVDATSAAVVGYLEPATAVALGAILLGERFGGVDAVGSVLILLGTALASIPPASPPSVPAGA